MIDSNPPPKAASASLILQEVSKTYGRFVAVDRLSLSLPAGSVFGLLGPNGAGKTTTIRMIMNIIAPDSGSVLFRGRPRTTADLDHIGYLPEERGLYRKMKVAEHLAFLGRIHGMSAAAANDAAHQWLERLQLADRVDRKVEELSKGQQQKIQLAATLMHDPELLILDEPFSGLDPINQSLFKDTLAELRGRDKTILFSTHIMEQAEKLCDHIALISGGKVVLQGELAEIKRRFGTGTYRLRSSGRGEDLKGIAGVDQITPVDGDEFLVQLEPGASPAAFLTAAAASGAVSEFVAASPDLEQIFIQTVQAASEGDG